MPKQFLKSTKLFQRNHLVIREIKYFRKVAALAIFFPICAALFEGGGIGLLLAFLQNLVNPSAPPIQTGIEWVDVSILGIYTSEIERLLRVSGLILLATFMRACFNYLTAVYMDLVKINLLDRLYKRIFEQLQSLNLSFFNKSRSGDIVNTLTVETTQLQQVIQYLSFVIVKSLVLAVYAIALMQISWQLSLLATALFTLLGVGLSKFNTQIREHSFGVSETRSKFTSIAIEFVNGIRTVQAFNTQDFERRRFHHASTEVMTASKKSIITLAIIRPIAEVLATTVLISMIVIGMIVFVANGMLQTASLLTFLFVLFRLVPAIQEINGCLGSINSFQGSIDNITKLLDPTDKPYLHNGALQFPSLQQAIEFVAVDFGYDPEHPILHDITLTLEKGKTTALVGASGAGKTTLADLIPRFYDPLSGEIRFDGVDLKRFDIHSIRNKMAIVSQDTFIFNTTLRNNIAYGSENVSEAEIIEATKLANALGFIQDMPEGFDTVLGDRGVRLSGGQRQRIAIARALLKQPEILILDEATSALDSESERLIQASLEQLSVGRTVIAIAHRLSTIARADKVVVLDQGKIVEQGTYQELLTHRGSLWKYHQMQHNLK
jgi:ATP-binding cassette, subfamily B, bacterial MsbA